MRKRYITILLALVGGGAWELSYVPPGEDTVSAIGRWVGGTLGHGLILLVPMAVIVMMGDIIVQRLSSLADTPEARRRRRSRLRNQ